MNPIEGFHETYDADARLTILRALAEQNDGCLNETMLTATLQAFGINKGRSYLRTQLRFLADEAGAVSLREMGTVMIAEIDEAGVDHVERRRVLDGVKRPSAKRR